MNLHALVRSSVNAVNPDVTGTVRVSTGYTTAANGQQRPNYTDQTGVVMQMQALDAKEIEHLDSLNIQGILRSFFLNGNVEGIDRRVGKGGDLILTPDGKTWLVVHVLATWDMAGWCQVVGQLQPS